MTESRREPVERVDHQLAAELPRLRAFLRKLAPGDADDLAQEVVERALRYRHAFRKDGSLLGWLKRTAFNVFLDHRQRSSRTPSPMGDFVWEVEAPARNDAEDRDHVSMLLEQLSGDERDVLIRFHCHGEQISEIAGSLGRPEGTVKSLLHRARRKLAASKRTGS